MAEVVLEKAGKTYPGGVRAVEGFDLRIADGEFVVLVGPSGCGKSTTLRMIAGLEEITEGTITIAGTVVNDVHARDRDIAMVFQNYALYPHMTVQRNLSFGLMRRRIHRSRLRALLSSDYRSAMREESAAIDLRVSEAARMLGITDLLDRQPRALSGGQRQRVALGRALVRAPQVFLFDEPLSNLDAKLRVEMRTELRVLHRQLNSTMVYVTHDQEEAMTLGDRLVVMNEGVVQQIDAPTRIYSHPVNRFVAGFVGTPSMNFSRARSMTRACSRPMTPRSNSHRSCRPVTVDRWCWAFGPGPAAVRGRAWLEVSPRRRGAPGRSGRLILEHCGMQLVSRVESTRSFQEGSTLWVEPKVGEGVHLFERSKEGRTLASA